MRQTAKNPTIPSLVHKKDRPKYIKEGLRTKKLPEVNGHYVLVKELPGNMKIFIPDGADEKEMVENYLTKYRVRIYK